MPRSLPGMTDDSRSTTPLRTLVKAMAHSGRGERVSIGDLATTLGPSAFGPLLLVPSLIAASPLSAIFGTATVCGLMIAALSAQLMARRSCIWLPRFVLRLSIQRRRIDGLYPRLERPLAWIERHARPRMRWLMSHPYGHLPGSVCFAIGCAMPLMELVPLSATLGGACVTLMVVGLLLEDGLYVALGIGFAIAMAGLAASAIAAVA